MFYYRTMRSGSVLLCVIFCTGLMAQNSVLHSWGVENITSLAAHPQEAGGVLAATANILYPMTEQYCWLIFTTLANEISPVCQTTVHIAVLPATSLITDVITVNFAEIHALSNRYPIISGLASVAVLADFGQNCVHAIDLQGMQHFTLFSSEHPTESVFDLSGLLNPVQ